MLYEVITIGELHMLNIQDIDFHAGLRITSYNVCYTKLLRHTDLCDGISDTADHWICLGKSLVAGDLGICVNG